MQQECAFPVKMGNNVWFVIQGTGKLTQSSGWDLSRAEKVIRLMRKIL